MLECCGVANSGWRDCFARRSLHMFFFAVLRSRVRGRAQRHMMHPHTAPTGLRRHPSNHASSNQRSKPRRGTGAEAWARTDRPLTARAWAASPPATHRHRPLDTVVPATIFEAQSCHSTRHGFANSHSYKRRSRQYSECDSSSHSPAEKPVQKHWPDLCIEHHLTSCCPPIVPWHAGS